MRARDARPANGKGSNRHQPAGLGCVTPWSRRLNDHSGTGRGESRNSSLRRVGRRCSLTSRSRIKNERAGHRTGGGSCDPDQGVSDRKASARRPQVGKVRTPAGDRQRSRSTNSVMAEGRTEHAHSPGCRSGQGPTSAAHQHRCKGQNRESSTPITETGRGGGRTWGEPGRRRRQRRGVARSVPPAGGGARGGGANQVGFGLSWRSTMKDQARVSPGFRPYALGRGYTHWSGTPRWAVSPRATPARVLRAPQSF